MESCGYSTKAELPLAKAHEDVQEYNHQGEQDGPNSWFLDIISNGRSYLALSNNTYIRSSSFWEKGFFIRHCVVVLLGSFIKPVFDIFFYLRASFGDLILSGNYDVVADVNEDGVINVLDVVILVNLILDNIPNDTVTDIDGNIYETVQIGDQLWMAENLKVTHYQNSDEIPYIYNDPQYGAYINYSNNANNVGVYLRLLTLKSF